MTNAEKYKEVFGMEVAPASCPTKECTDCPCHTRDNELDFCLAANTYRWWNTEYKEVNND